MGYRSSGSRTDLTSGQTQTQTQSVDTILYFLTYTYWHIGILTSSEVAIITRCERHSIIFKIFEIVAHTDRCNPVDINEDE